MSNHLFVYGTLRKDIKHPMHQTLAEETDFIGEGRFQGKLYDLGSYPGAVPSSQSSDLVKGEIYALHDAALLRRLDEYEGSHFRRTEVSVLVENGGKVAAWIYLYDGAANGLKTIPSGDYLEFRKP